MSDATQDDAGVVDPDDGDMRRFEWRPEDLELVDPDEDDS